MNRLIPVALFVAVATCVPTTKAERIEPDLTCGPPIERKDVKVVDLQDFLTVEE